MSWPSAPSTTYLDSGGDDASDARAEIYALALALITIINSRGAADGFPAIDGDGLVQLGTNFLAGLNASSNPVFQLDSGDKLIYNRSTNSLEQYKDSVLIASYPFTGKLLHSANNLSDVASAATARTNLSVPSISEVARNLVQGVKSDTFSTSSSSFTALTGLSATITPSSASNKVLVRGVIYAKQNGENRAMGQLLRGSTPIGIGDAASNRTRATVGFNIYDSPIGGYPFEFLDTPATTSAITYSFQVKTSGGTLCINKDADDTDVATTGRYISTITVEEIK